MMQIMEQGWVCIKARERVVIGDSHSADVLSDSLSEVSCPLINLLSSLEVLILCKAPLNPATHVKATSS